MLLGLPFRRRRSAPLVPAGERIYAIGDIHGRIDLFHRLLELLQEDEKRRGPATTRIVVIGDFIDRGPQSAKLVSTLEWWQRNSSRVTILKGNHEVALLESLAGNPHAQRMWLSYGGLETMRSFGVEPQEGCSLDELAALMRSRISASTISWLQQLPISKRIGDYFFCHAGVKPGVPLEQQKPEDLLWIADEFLRSRRDHGAAIVHGHTICGSRVQFAPNRIASIQVPTAPGFCRPSGWRITANGRFRPRRNPFGRALKPRAGREPTLEPSPEHQVAYIPRPDASGLLWQLPFDP